ncbi:flagellar protein FliT [Clostridium tyrobutyricum]|uniref:flagellar protein FliT n=1 Tax=Clostridium tyrobutyricum TaxID=1519 RepID=UPI0005809367|nr:flagellar protein FliT [Clostridium tyrobutyricum]
MVKNVEDILMSYKNCTEHIIELLKREEFDFLQDAMQKRQYILDKLISNIDKKSDTREIYNKMHIKELEEETQKLMKNKAGSIKEKLKSISVNRTASSAYGNIGSSAKIFSKKI